MASVGVDPPFAFCRDGNSLTIWRIRLGVTPSSRAICSYDQPQRSRIMVRSRRNALL
jgi:hypothetical protein